MNDTVCHQRSMRRDVELVVVVPLDVVVVVVSVIPVLDRVSKTANDSKNIVLTLGNGYSSSLGYRISLR